MKKLNQRGFHVIELVIVVLVLAAIGFVGWRVFGGKKDTKPRVGDEVNTQQPAEQADGSNQSSVVTWDFNGTKWEPSGQAPECPAEFKFDRAPTDLSKATHTLYPGQTRGGNYKTHGGWRFNNSTDNKATIKIPVDSHLIKASRYYEQGNLQYFMVFTTPCGFAYRLDHLRTLTPKFAAIMDKLPKPKVDDSRTTKLNPAIAVSSGETVATAVGFRNPTNVSFDFGVYDLRNKNNAPNRPDDQEFNPYALCLFDYLPSADEARARALPAADPVSGKNSDYC